MPRVDFYEAGADELLFACRLIEKAWWSGHQVYAHVAGPAEATQLDERLWAFRASSFVPHALAGAGVAPVVIGHGGAPGGACEVLVNLCGAVPDFFTQFQRVAELVPADQPRRQASRQRYAFYKKQGCELAHHQGKRPG